VRSLLMPLHLATNARQLELVTDVDPCIDYGCVPASPTLALPADAPAGCAPPHADALVVGDETRLTQITTNLANSVCKFT
ncbi:hypothetical protein BC834DRAFT_804721, partial [Gloeopeniophorella convolvens]